MTTHPIKPLNARAYGSIPHLPGSRRGPADKGLLDHQAAICLVKTRDKHDLITVQEKLDGSCVSVAKINGEIVALIRAGYRAVDSKWSQHHHFAAWAVARRDQFDALLSESERCVGEWLMEAHGTRYALTHEPFVIFDLMRGADRSTAHEVFARCFPTDFVTPCTVHIGGAIGIEEAMGLLGNGGHGALDPVEGAVWRVERHGKVDFLGKFVREGKVDGLYLADRTGLPAVYNWEPTK